MIRRFMVLATLMLWPLTAVADSGLNVTVGQGTASDSSGSVLQPASPSQLQPGASSSSNLQQPADGLQSAGGQQDISNYGDTTINAAAAQPLSQSPTGGRQWWWLVAALLLLVLLAGVVIWYRPRRAD